MNCSSYRSAPSTLSVIPQYYNWDIVTAVSIECDDLDYWSWSLLEIIFSSTNSKMYRKKNQRWLLFHKAKRLHRVNGIMCFCFDIKVRFCPADSIHINWITTMIWIQMHSNSLQNVIDFVHFKIDPLRYFSIAWFRFSIS